MYFTQDFRAQGETWITSCSGKKKEVGWAVQIVPSYLRASYSCYIPVIGNFNTLGRGAGSVKAI
jgi:hypothetical protein